MPTSVTRHRVEIPLDLFHALNQAAADTGMPTNALITVWLLRMLEERRPDLQVRDPYRSGVALYERRPRRPYRRPSLAHPASPQELQKLRASFRRHFRQRSSAWKRLASCSSRGTRGCGRVSEHSAWSPQTEVSSRSR